MRYIKLWISSLLICLSFVCSASTDKCSLKGKVRNITDTAEVVAIIDLGNIVWLGTKGGLIKYNEEAEKVENYYTTAEGLIDNRITFLKETPKGLIIGTEGGLSYFEPETETWVSFSGPQAISADYVAGENKAYIFHNQGFSQLDIKSGKIENVRLVSNETEIVNNTFRENSKFWGIVNSTWLICFDGKTGEKRIFSEKDGLLGEAIKQLYFTPYGVWATYTSKYWYDEIPKLPGEGLSRYDRKKQKWQSFTEQDGLATEYIRDAAFYEGRFWVTCEGYYDSKANKFIHGGLCCYDPKEQKWTTFQQISGQNRDNPTAIAVINDELWVATQQYKTWHQVGDPFAMIATPTYTIDSLRLTLNKYDKDSQGWTTYYIADDADFDKIQSLFKRGEELWIVLIYGPKGQRIKDQVIVQGAFPAAGLGTYHFKDKKWQFVGYRRICSNLPSNVVNDVWSVRTRSSYYFGPSLDRGFVAKWDEKEKKWHPLDLPTRLICPVITALPQRGEYAGTRDGYLLTINPVEATAEITARVKLPDYDLYRIYKGPGWSTVITSFYRDGGEAMAGCCGFRGSDYYYPYSKKGMKPWVIRSGLLKIGHIDEGFEEARDVPWVSKNRLPEEGVICLHTGERKIWTGTWHCGVFYTRIPSSRKEQMKWHSIGPEGKAGGVNWEKHFDARAAYSEKDTSLIDNAVLAIVENKDRLWALFGDGLWGYNMESKEWKYYGGPKTRLFDEERWLPRYHALFRSDLVLGKDGLWVTSPEGTFFFQPDTEKWEELEPELPGRCLFWHNDLLWIGTDEGLVCYNPESRKLVRYRERDGLADDVINDIGYWWYYLMVGTNNGLSLINLKELK